MRFPVRISDWLFFSVINFVIWSGAVLVEAQQVQAPKPASPENEPIDFRRAKSYFDRNERGEKLTPDEAAYLARALAARNQQGRNGSVPVTPREKTGLKPLCDMTAADRYQGEDGGLYGNGRNEPTPEYRRLAETELARIRPLDRNGKPDVNGRIGFLSISMSNATQEFSRFKQVADPDRSKSQAVTIVDGAQGGQAMAEWAAFDARPWSVAEQRLQAVGVANEQVQVAWIKLANKGPRGKLDEHGRQLQRDTVAVIQNAKKRFPNLRVAYLASRIYGGYGSSPLNPEPYAYESAFVVRWLIQDQMRGEESLNFKSDAGTVKAPLLLWGPYFWADGVQPRGSDKLTWQRGDLGGDGTHPSEVGRDKVAGLMLTFFKTDSLAKTWYVGTK